MDGKRQGLVELGVDDLPTFAVAHDLVAPSTNFAENLSCWDSRISPKCADIAPKGAQGVLCSLTL